MTATTERACESAWESSTQAVKRRAWRASVLPHPSPKQETGWTRSLFDEPKTVNFEITWRQFIKLGGGEAINIGVRIQRWTLPSCFSRSRSRVICSWPELKREMSTWPYNLSKEHAQSTSSKLRGSTISKTLEKTCRLGDKDISFPSGENSNSPLYPTEIYTAYARKYYLDKLYRPFEN